MSYIKWTMFNEIQQAVQSTPNEPSSPGEDAALGKLPRDLQLQDGQKKNPLQENMPQVYTTIVALWPCFIETTYLSDNNF